ncbi:hypothetical protein AB6A40_000714 [Gnathostoma spinigerum]|uniref:Uncharacterized protein n=1 Tax=Gnathostoma spinigerum TaxID=75299 RepID=A0ABD6E3M2_9BILA
MALLIFLLFCLYVVAQKPEGSGADEKDWDESEGAPLSIEAINKILSHYTHHLINSTVQLEVVRADEEIRRGRLDTVLWIHQIWDVPNVDLGLFASSPLHDDEIIFKIPLERSSALILSPQTVFKNALYFRENHTPLLNAVLHISTKGRFAIHAKYNVDIPCVRIVPMKTDYIQYPICGREIGIGKDASGVYRSYNEVVCELRYGSYVRDTSRLRLDWAFNAIDGHSAPCSNELVPHCLIQEIQTFRRQTDFLGEEYDELIACFLLSYRTADKWGLMK